MQVAVLTRTCSTCKADKPPSEFYPSLRTKQCKPCRSTYMKGWRQRNRNKTRQYAFAYKYDLTPEQYDAMLVAQDGRCAICERTPEKRLVVDHAHDTRKVRGLLCDACNHALHLIEQPSLLAKAIAYLDGGV